MSQLHYIYLVHEIQFQNPHQDIYKIGKTTRKHYNRINQYAKGVKELLVMECDDCHKCEKQLIEIFKKKFKQRKDVAGEESFEGDKYEMINTICTFLKKQPDLSEEIRLEELEIKNKNETTKSAKNKSPKKIKNVPQKMRNSNNSGLYARNSNNSGLYARNSNNSGLYARGFLNDLLVCDTYSILRTKH